MGLVWFFKEICMSKNKKSVFVGAATALVTPFRGGMIDYDALSGLIEKQISDGIDAIVIAGTTGEASTLSDEEYTELVKLSVQRIAGRVPVIVGSGSNSTERACALTKKASELGADALLVVTPYYNKASKSGLERSYTEIAGCTDKPVILYNVPSRTGVNITLDTYKELAKLDNIVAVKEAGRDIGAIGELIFECGDDLDVYSGNDDTTLPLLALGGLGVISVISNIIPKQMRDICRYYLGGNTLEARKGFKGYYRLIREMSSDTNPIPIKTALSALGYCEEEFRLPLCSMTEKSREHLLDVLREYRIN